MTEHRFVSLGCSITAQDGYINYFNQKYNLDIVNLAVSAGSNQLQSFRLNNLLVDRQVGPSTTLFWQLTSPQRHFEIRDFDNSHGLRRGESFSKNQSYNWIETPIKPYGGKHAAFLCNAEHLYLNYLSYEYVLQTTVCDIYKWSYLVKDIVVYLGWSFFAGAEYVDRALEVLKDRPNITIIPKEHSVLDLCMTRGWPLADDLHPSREGYVLWAQEILEPMLVSRLDNTSR